MTLDALQKEIQLEADLKGAEVLLGIWNRVKILSDQDVTLYCSLIDIYTNFRIYHHRVKRWLEEAYSFGDNSSNKRYANMVKLNELCERFFHETKYPKAELRQKLTDSGINYRQFHPRTCHLDMSKVLMYPHAFEPKSLTKSETSCIL